MDAQSVSAHCHAMKASSFLLTGLASAATLCAALTTAACANAPQSDQAEQAPSQPTQSDTYLDAPQTPGTWRYVKEPGETLAIYGEAKAQPAFILRCGDGVVSLGRFTGAEQSETRVMSITTETVTSQIEAGPVPDMPMILAADLQPRDPLLDAMAITKGRFMVDVEGQDPLYLPAWVEVSRVIEDCR
jgi:hypothetical protein